MNTPDHFMHLREKFVTIVAFGDSITEVNHHTTGHLNYVGLLGIGLQGRDVFPHGFTIINSGIGGDDVGKALLRMDRDVVRFNPDIVILGFGMNDQNSFEEEVFRGNLNKTIGVLREKSTSVIIIRTPNPMVDMNSGLEMESRLSEVSKIIREVSKTHGVLCVDHYTMWTLSMKSDCRRDMIHLMSDPAHPNGIGHRRIYHELSPLFNSGRHLFYEWERVLQDQGSLD